MGYVLLPGGIIKCAGILLAILLVSGGSSDGWSGSRAEALKVLKEKGLPLTAAALIESAEKGDLVALEALLDAGMGTNARRKEDRSTALIAAAKARRLQAVDILLKRGADINAKYPWGTPLIAAADSGHLPEVELLLKRGTNVNARAEEEGVTALSLAAFEGHLPVVKALLAHGAEVDVLAFDWDATPLILAAQEGHLEIVKVLVVHGANVNFRAGNGTTVLEAASDHPTVV